MFTIVIMMGNKKHTRDFYPDEAHAAIKLFQQLGRVFAPGWNKLWLETRNVEPRP